MSNAKSTSLQNNEILCTNCQKTVNKIHLAQRCVVRVMVLVNWVIIGTIVRTEKCPTSQVTVVFITGVKDI